MVGAGEPEEFSANRQGGRQELSYSDERIIGRGDWGNLGRVFDSAKLRWAQDSWWAEAFVGRIAMPDDHNFNMPNDYDYLSGVYVSSTGLAPIQESQFYAVAHDIGAQAADVNPGWIGSPSRIQDTGTIGIRAKSLPNALRNWDYQAELAGQFGSVNPGSGRLDQDGLMAEVEGGYTWKDVFGKPRLGFGYNFCSGDDDPSNGHSGTFEPVYLSSHK